ncbi:nuclear transport factor 2 family protein [Rapidithrix thailandica]|uniref:Nuclear transport factor 2 family protein n=1 Tax=Rapidithrix thailandica TaxID=413964 RepID=A0AAW9SG00_9BACT
MKTEHQQNHRKESVISYFKKVDKGDLTYYDLFTEDVQFFFPKFGLACGKNAIKRFGKNIGRFLKSIQHDIENFHYIISGDSVVVEGKENGVTHDDKAWPDGNISQGLFCSVFEFEGDLIKRMHIYVDPDFTSEDQDRIQIYNP